MTTFTRYYLTESGELLSESVEYEPDDTLLSEQAGADTYAKDIRGIARVVWQGLPLDGYSLMWDTVGLGITAAWAQGAASCGIAEEDLTLDERIRRDMLVNEQRGHIMGFLDWVYAHRRDGPDKLKQSVILARAAIWGNRWSQAYQVSMTMACANQKTMWMLGPTEHCDSCLKLNGKAKRNSYWQRMGILPRVPGAPYLKCQGYNCQCTLELTDEPLSKGPLPRLP